MKIEKEDIIDTSKLDIDEKGDVLISNQTLLRVLSDALGKPVVGFTDEPTMSAWWLEVKR
jgi:hypothetical protein